MKTQSFKFGNYDLGKDFVVMAGPCSIESEDQFRQTAHHVKACGAHILRGGMYKLRTSPESFQGMGSEAFQLVKMIKTEVGLPFISEVTDPRQIPDMMDFVDVFQVGSRNMHNYALLKELGQVDKPVLLKRGFAGTIKEWLLAADYVVKGGNTRVALCERGIRTFETATRNTFDINAIAYIKQHSHFPIIADTSHGTGETALVTPVALAAAAAGADGLIIETHPNPAVAQSDGFQALNFDQFQQLMAALPKVLEAVGRSLHKGL